MNEAKRGSSTGPSTTLPPIGFGRSSTQTVFWFAFAAIMTYASVEMYVYARSPTSCMSNRMTSTLSSIAALGLRVAPYRL